LESRNREGQLGQATPLETRVVRDDARCSFAGLDHRLRQRGAGIGSALRELLMVDEFAALPEHVAAHLDGDLAERRAARPRRDRRHHRLEVEEGDGRLERGQRLGSRTLRRPCSLCDLEHLRPVNASGVPRSGVPIENPIRAKSVEPQQVAGVGSAACSA